MIPTPQLPPPERLRRADIWIWMKPGARKPRSVPPCPEAPFWLSVMSRQGFTQNGHRLPSLYRAGKLPKRG